MYHADLTGACLRSCTQHVHAEKRGIQESDDASLADRLERCCFSALQRLEVLGQQVPHISVDGFTVGSASLPQAELAIARLQILECAVGSGQGFLRARCIGREVDGECTSPMVAERAWLYRSRSVAADGIAEQAFVETIRQRGFVAPFKVSSEKLRGSSSQSNALHVNLAAVLPRSWCCEISEFPPEVCGQAAIELCQRCFSVSFFLFASILKTSSD